MKKLKLMTLVALTVLPGSCSVDYAWNTMHYLVNDCEGAVTVSTADSCWTIPEGGACYVGSIIEMGECVDPHNVLGDTVRVLFPDSTTATYCYPPDDPYADNIFNSSHWVGHNGAPDEVRTLHVCYHIAQ